MAIFMKIFVPTNKGLGHLGLLVQPKSPYYFKFYMLMTKVSHSIVTSLLHLTMIGTKKHGVGLENRLGPSMINPTKRLLPSMTSTSTCVHFSNRTNLDCQTNSLSIKHANAQELRSAWASIVTSLLHLTMISTKKHGARLEDRLGPFSLHDASRSNLVLPTETKHARLLTPLIVD
jgi:hypothetical protein